MTQNVIPRRPVSLVTVARWIESLDDSLWLSTVAGWLCAFRELIVLDGMAAYYLGAKFPEEADEAREAWRRYIMTKTLFPHAKHQLNSLWLHAIDEAADVVNSHAAMMFDKAIRRNSEYEMTARNLASSVAVMLTTVETQTGALKSDTRFQLSRAVLSMAISKMFMTSLRPHADKIRVSWGEFPTGEHSQ